jgi:thiol-disulfide isomerase/thioredoxin
MGTWFNARRSWIATALLLPAAIALASPAAPQLPRFRTIAGQELSPKDMHGKVTVVALFSVTCPFCMNEAPKLQKLHRNNQAVLNVVAVNVDRTDALSGARRWARKYALTHYVSVDYARFEAVLGKSKGIPALYVFDRAGRLVRTEVGEMLDEDFDDIGHYAQSRP